MEELFIYITTQKEFIHQYKDAPEEVSFLRYPHRHVAHVKVKIQVFNEDREIEFILFKREIERLLNTEESMNSTTNCSCETIANTIKKYVIKKYGSHRKLEISVSEDGENGCQLLYKP